MGFSFKVGLMKNFLLILLFCSGHLVAINTQQLQKALCGPYPFSYLLRARVFPAYNPDADPMVVCHGFGHDCQVGGILRENKCIQDHIISFNFPDANISNENFNAYQTSFGSIQEILPPLYLLKQLVVNGAERISLYGFSAGGGAVVNVLAVLNRNDYDKDLQTIGINQEMKQKISMALQKGSIILDAPLKSMDEIAAVKGGNQMDRVLADRYRMNRLRPIDSLKGLTGLSYKILINFQYPDEAIPNRDDDLFVKNIQQANSNGITWSVYGSDGGHNCYHKSLWDAYYLLQLPGASSTKFIDKRK